MSNRWQVKKCLHKFKITNRAGCNIFSECQINVYLENYFSINHMKVGTWEGLFANGPISSCSHRTGKGHPNCRMENEDDVLLLQSLCLICISYPLIVLHSLSGVHPWLPSNNGKRINNDKFNRVIISIFLSLSTCLFFVLLLCGSWQMLI